MDDKEKQVETDKEKYEKRVAAEAEQSKSNRKKRDEKKKTLNLNNLKSRLEAERLKEYSTGLITWKRKDNIVESLEGYIDNQKCFKINHGIYKYSLTVYVDTGDKKDKNLKTSFELHKLQIVAESIAKKIPIKIKEEEKK